jgi:hypothetical protein
MNSGGIHPNSTLAKYPRVRESTPTENSPHFSRERERGEALSP